MYEDVDWAVKAGRGPVTHPLWTVKPCVRVGSSGLAFNPLAAQTFSLRQGDGILIGVTGGNIIFKMPGTPEEILSAYAIARTKLEAYPQFRVNGKSIVRFLTKRGIPFGTYEMRMNAQHRIMEALVPKQITKGETNDKT